MADAKGAYIGGVPVQFKDAAARAMISDEYNSAETYAKGNLCIYNGKIYEAIKETTGTWDATAWEETTLAKVNGKLNGDIASLTEKMKYINIGYSGESGTIILDLSTIPEGVYLLYNIYWTGYSGWILINRSGGKKITTLDNSAKESSISGNTLTLQCGSYYCTVCGLKLY